MTGDIDPLVVVPLRLRASTISNMKQAISEGRYPSEAEIARAAIDSYLEPDIDEVPEWGDDILECLECGTENPGIALYCKECGLPALVPREKP